VAFHINRWVIVVLMALILAVGPGVEVAPVVAGSNPCEEVQNDPGPPTPNPEPTIGGRVTDGDALAGIDGATMKVYQCEEGEATQVDTATTGGGGYYVSDILDPGYYYYVEAVMNGPLEGMEPAEGTSNPSDAVGLGESVTDLDFEFVDPD